jgi:glycosyltransferase involved in cell wall biosynthesis
LLTRAAQAYRVVCFEEPVYEPVARPALRQRQDPSGVTIATPVLPQGTADPDAAQRRLLDALVGESPQQGLITWYYTPMALGFSAHLKPDVCVYDCMDELSAFRGAPPGLRSQEDELFKRSDVVFTGGRSLYEAKRTRHADVFCFPSSIDVAHFHRARLPRPDPADQAAIPFPRIGFFGVIDERMDLGLVAATAVALPQVQFVMLGPVSKIDAGLLPLAPNLHWLGPKPYQALPEYLANWQAGWMPFALNEATRFISPTKTPEFLAAGLPVTSTAVRDVVDPYGKNGVVRIADQTTMVAALTESLGARDPGWQERVDRMLSETSWTRTWATMHRHIVRRQLIHSRIQTAPCRLALRAGAQA